jgi:hypothetical protein
MKQSRVTLNVTADNPFWAGVAMKLAAERVTERETEGEDEAYEYSYYFKVQEDDIDE